MTEYKKCNNFFISSGFYIMLLTRQKLNLWWYKIRYSCNKRVSKSSRSLDLALFWLFHACEKERKRLVQYLIFSFYGNVEQRLLINSLWLIYANKHEINWKGSVWLIQELHVTSISNKPIAQVRVDICDQKCIFNSQLALRIRHSKKPVVTERWLETLVKQFCKELCSLCGEKSTVRQQLCVFDWLSRIS